MISVQDALEGSVRLLTSALSDGNYIQTRDIGNRKAYYISIGNVDQENGFYESIPAETSSDKAVTLEKFRIIIDVNKPLGKGGGGVVYKGIVSDMRGQSSQTICIKQANLDEPCLQSLINEIEVFNQLGSCENQSIIRYLFSTCITTTSPEIPLLALEYFDGSNLFEMIDECKMSGTSRFSEAEVISIMKQLISAVSSLQQYGIFHCDIKPENILYNREKGELKLIDFGFALNCFGQDVKSIATGGTYEYMAPETLLLYGIEFNSDIYSLGATFYHLITLERPWCHDHQYRRRRDVKAYIIQQLKLFEEMYNNGESVVLPMQTNLSYISKDYPHSHKIVRSMLNFKAIDRPSCGTIKEDLGKLHIVPRKSSSRNSLEGRVYSEEAYSNNISADVGSTSTYIPTVLSGMSSTGNDSAKRSRLSLQSSLHDVTFAASATCEISQPTSSMHRMQPSLTEPRPMPTADSMTVFSVKEDYPDMNIDGNLQADNISIGSVSTQSQEFEVVAAGITHRTSTDSVGHITQVDDNNDDGGG